MTRDLSPIRYADAPHAVQERLAMCLLDLMGVGYGGAQTDLSDIICRHATRHYGGTMPFLFAAGTASPVGLALAGGMTIDALDGHDGHNLTKGHVGCGLLPGLLALAPEGCSGAEFLDALLLGYEVGTRLGQALHATAPDYHTSGAWIAPTVAIAGARLRGNSPDVARHAAGIAEYHGPRSQMMRCIDHPTMVKDGSGWGAMAGVSALLLAEDGFTGAPAITLEAPETDALFSDLGTRWAVLEQYFKPYPVCRWAQAPVEAALELRAAHALKPGHIKAIEVESFHECARLATLDPDTTEQAQYSTAFPVAVALVHGTLGPDNLDGPGLLDREVRRLAASLTFTESAEANAAFPGIRLARVTLHLSGGRTLKSGWHHPKWDHTAPPSVEEVIDKYRALVHPVMGVEDAIRIEETVSDLARLPLSALTDLICGTVPTG